jgi:hypothetical protein
VRSADPKEKGVGSGIQEPKQKWAKFLNSKPEGDGKVDLTADTYRQA